MTHPKQPDTPAPSPEMMHQTLKHFAVRVARDVITDFWPERPQHPELQGNGVSVEELEERVMADMMQYILETRAHITDLVKEASYPEGAFFGNALPMLASTAKISARRSYGELVQLKLSGVDDLTGLPRKRIFTQDLRGAIEANHRFGHGFSLIFFDLDHFKSVNDRYGHGVGDKVLVEMARRLKAAGFREVDRVARFGGEEFVVILPETPVEGAAILAQRISEQISGKPFSITVNQDETLDLSITASIGLTEYTNAKDDPDGEKILARADHALYILKGERPDSDDVTKDRRGQIACDGRVLSHFMIEEFKPQFQEPGTRSSLPAPI